MLSKALVVASYRSKLDALAGLGVDLTAIVPESWKEAGSAIVFEQSDDSGYRIINTKVAWNGHFHLHYYPTFGRIVREVRPDIIHVDEEPYNLATYLAVRSGLRAGSATLFFTWQNIRRRYPPPFGTMERYIYDHAAYGIAGSEDALSALHQKGFSKPAKVVPQFGVDVHTFRPVEPTERPFTFGFVGRLVPEKGVDDLLAAFRQLTDCRLIITGDGPLAEQIDRQTAELQEHGLVERHPRLPSSQVPQLLHRLDALVLPSRTTPRWKEQYGRVLIEAMASGVPVVGSDSGEIPNVIGHAGITFPEGDSNGLAEVLLKLSSDTRLVDDLRRKGRQRAVDVFSQEAIARETMEVYSEMLWS